MIINLIIYEKQTSTKCNLTKLTKIAKLTQKEKGNFSFDTINIISDTVNIEKLNEN